MKSIGGMSLNIELNITNQCNLRCSYCSEFGKYNSKNFGDIKEKFYVFFDDLLKSDFFNKNYSDIALYFWGGEPTLESNLILEIVRRYEDNKNVRFMMYTNGYDMPEKLKEKIKNLKYETVGQHRKFFTQISYDGNPIHDIKRKTTHKGSSSDKVIDLIKWYGKNNIPFSIKSTVTYDTLKYIYEAYVDITNLVNEFDSFYGFGYFPTLDYFNHHSGDNIEEYKKDMVDSLKKLIFYLLKNDKKIKNVNFKWFLDSKANCSAGADLFSIDTNGDITACHGCLYTNNRDHVLGHIDDGVSCIEIASEKYRKLMPITPEECKTCIATFCVRCNTVRYENSTKDTFEEKWNDYTNNNALCSIYKEAGKMTRVYNKLKSKK